MLSFGQNGRWRKAMVDAVVGISPSRVLDVATGPAGVALQLAARTGAQVTGIDVTPQMLKAAQANLARSPAGEHVTLVLGRAEDLPFADATFDALSFTYLLRYVADPAATLAELVRVVKPGGVIASLEFHPPRGVPWHPLWFLYTRFVLPAAGWALGGREWLDVGRFLGPSISGHYRRYPVTWLIGARHDAGVDAISTRLMSLGGGLVMWGRKSVSHSSAGLESQVAHEPALPGTDRA